MRCFIGVPVSASLANSTTALSQALPEAVPRDNLHLTLAFLGELPVEKARGLIPALRDLSACHRPFSLVFKQYQPFPEAQGPFMALTCPPSPSLAALHGGLWQCLEEQGVERPQRTFRPHITLGRFHESALAKTGLWALKVDRIWLYQSEQDGAGPRYRCISEQRLHG